jgi:hypothetical protein
MLSSLSEAARLVISQYLLCDMRFSVVEGLFYLAPAGFVGISVVSLVVEVPNMDIGQVLVTLKGHFGYLLLASAAGLVINALSFAIIQLTSAVMLKGIGTARTAGFVLFCATVLGEPVSVVQFVGYGLSLLCFAYYNYLIATGAANEAKQ